VANTLSKPQKFDLKAVVQRWVNLNGTSVTEMPEVHWKLGEKVLDASRRKLVIGPKEEQTFTLTTRVNGTLDLWSPGSPALYGLVLSLDGKSGIIDRDYTRFGWRQFDIRGTELLLNGAPIQIRGDSWHFMGVPQMSRRYAYAWYRMLQDANANGVRLHAQVFPRFYLEVADEMGICILDETAIWSSDGGPKIDSDIYWEACSRHVQGMVLRDRNHPSVMGWSVCNETLPVTKHVFNAPDSLVERNITEINRWVSIVRAHDPTRTWISGDGETQAETDLPTVIGHYGGPSELLRWSDQGKPWGIGETGMAYYGTPAQVAKINGDRAYESQLGRMEGLAGEAFDLISMQRDKNASYTSVFNLAWYGLKPLPLGLRETARAPELTDGIFFPAYEEGRPGYQPERLGPYTSTFNPGYDPMLPLYAPWPLFDAVKAAFSDRYQSIENAWALERNNTVGEEPQVEKEGMVFLGTGEGDLKRQFEQMAILFEPLQSGKKQLILLDGAHPPAANPSLVSDLKSAIYKGSSLVIWGATPASETLIESLTGNQLEFYARNASSYIIKGAHPMLNGQRNASLYFTELTRDPVSTFTFGGDWVEEAHILLEACGTDWRQWNYQPEAVKTAMVYRDEMEQKAPGVVIAGQSDGAGELIVSAVDFFSMGQQSRFLARNLVSKMGGVFQGQLQEMPPAIDAEGVLRNVNYYGTVKIDSRDIELLFENQPLEEEEFMQVHVGTLTNGTYWDLLSAGDAGVFDFLAQPVKHRNYASCYLGFWIYSPRSLTDLLIEPDMPRLDMHAGVDDLLAFSINGKPVTYYIAENGFVEDAFTYEGIPLEKGWNHMLIKVAQDTGDWKCKVRFTSTKPGFMKEIKAVADR
jgi:beta-galactosidase